MTTKPILQALLLAVAGLAASVALQVHAQDQGRGGRHGMPPELRAQLSAEQIAEFEAATSFEEKKALLDSWGIQMPAPPNNGRHHGPPPPRDDENQNQQQASGGTR